MAEPATNWWFRRPALNWAELIGFAVALALAGGGLGALAAKGLSPEPGSCDTKRVATAALPSVVSILVTGSGVQRSATGTVIRADGVILTNAHVLNADLAAGSVDVVLNNGESQRASVVGTDPVTDLAVLKVDRNKLPALLLAPREALTVGEPVVALGSPLAQTGTVTSGIVSALGRNVSAPVATGGTTVITGAIQTDAAISPGNSGGPLVTCEGRLVGVNTAVSGIAASDGTGLAVPASTAQRVVEELLAGGTATHPWIGAQTTEVSQDTADRFSTRAGLFVQSVSPAGPAATAGLQAGDVITRINGEPATSVWLGWVLSSAKVNDPVSVEYSRGDATRQVTVQLTEQHP